MISTEGDNKLMSNIKKTIGKVLYFSLGIHMPSSFSRLNFGARKFRQMCAKLILEDCGDWVNIEKGVHFGDCLKIGEGSGIGINSRIPGSTVIGDNVMMGQDCLFFDKNHRTDDLTIPMGGQGFTECRPITIGNDVWIGARVIILPGVKIGNG